MDDQQKLSVLALIKKTGRKTESCVRSGVKTRELNKALKTDLGFAQLFDEAMDEYRDMLVGEMQRRACEGLVQPVYFKGMRVDKLPEDQVRSYSDTMLVKLIQRHIPEFRDKLETTNVNLNTSLADIDSLTPMQRQKLRELLDAQPGNQPAEVETGDSPIL